ncbi:MAG TPA: MucR family transcriptional regulator [Allosphingosinicella sp.]|jgi:predicted transcriptional regulator
MSDLESRTNLRELTADLVGAFVAHNNVRGDDLPKVIADVYGALAGLGAASPQPEEAPAFKGAVTARKSLASREHIISMIDGKPYKSLKRHLSAKGLTPADYRQRYGLPASYPMVAPGYSEKRREVAKRLGLGRKPRVAGAKAAGGGDAPKRRGRRGAAKGS